MKHRILATVACVALIVGALVTLGSCGRAANLPILDVSGTNPQIADPDTSLIPIIDIAPADRWTAEQTPMPADGLAVTAYARDLEHPRWLHVLPNGDVLVAETNAPPRPDDGTGLRGWVMGKVMKRAGAAVPSADRITLLRDADGDGVAEVRSTFIEELHSPFGMQLIGDDLYIANTDAIVRVPYQPDLLSTEESPEHVASLPAGTINHHWTKNIIASPDGSRLYVTVGSNSNIAENGIENEHHRAAILEVDPATGSVSLFASGLRNPNGLAWEPQSGELWTAVNERDGLGSDLVPDYITSVQRGGFYGWPYSYYGDHVDARVEPPRPDLVAEALVPDYALGPHTASIGLVFYEGTHLPAHYAGGAFVAQHGSWNRKPLSGYKVVFVPFEGGEPAGLPSDVLTGFISENEQARGRPVGLGVDSEGALLVADDVGNTVWRVTNNR